MKSCLHILTIALIALGLLVGCSRKEDDELPSRIGDMQVRFVAFDSIGMPASFTVGAYLYGDTLRQDLVRSQQIVTQSGVERQIIWRDLRVGFFQLVFRIDQPTIENPEAPYLTAFVNQGTLTSTGLIAIPVTPNGTYWRRP